jgi:hypothetical protein
MSSVRTSVSPEALRAIARGEFGSDHWPQTTRGTNHRVVATESATE